MVQTLPAGRAHIAAGGTFVDLMLVPMSLPIIDVLKLSIIAAINGGMGVAAISQGTNMIMSPNPRKPSISSSGSGSRLGGRK